MKINLKINETVCNCRFNYDETSKNYLRPICDVSTIIIPYNSISINFIPNKDMTILGHEIISINLANKNEVDVILHSKAPTVSWKFNRDEFSEYDIDSKMSGSNGDNLANQLYESVPKYNHNAIELYLDRVREYDTIDYIGSDYNILGNFDDRYNTCAEHERQKLHMYTTFQKFRLKIDSCINYQNKKYREDILNSVYLNLKAKRKERCSKSLKIAILNRCGIPLNEDEINFLRTKMSTTILGRMFVKQLEVAEYEL